MNYIVTGILLFIVTYIILSIYSKIGIKISEGLTTMTTTASSGVAGSAQTYSETVKSKSTQLQDILLIAKYRKDYENIIINMEDYVNLLIVQEILNLPLDGSATSFANIGTLQQSKLALIDAMKFVDGQ
jgi:hypothetical protein